MPARRHETTPMKRGVELGRDRSYWFPMRPDALWSALAETGDYRSWWPSLTDLEADGLAAGAVWRCTIRPPLPFPLRFAIHLDDVVRPTLVTAHISGDIAGTARLDVAPHGNGLRCPTHIDARPEQPDARDDRDARPPDHPTGLQLDARHGCPTVPQERHRPTLNRTRREAREVRAERSVARGRLGRRGNRAPTPDPWCRCAQPLGTSGSPSNLAGVPGRRSRGA